MSGDCSPLRPIATWNPERVLWETGQIDLFTGLPEPFSEIWPTSGSMRNGSVYPRRLSVPAIDDSESSSSRGLLPTPRTSDTNGAGVHGDGGMDLRTAVTLLPAPRATDGTKGGPNQRGSSGDLMLPSAVQLLAPPAAATPSTMTPTGSAPVRAAGHAQTPSGDVPLLPTPTARDWKDGHPQPNVPTSGLLGREAWNLLPTPTAADSRASGGSTPSDVTLTDAVVRTSLGATTNQRFDGGSPSPDGLPRHLWSQGALDLD